MAKRKEGHKPIFVEVPDALMERLRAVMDFNRRTLTAQVLLAIEQNVEQEEKAAKKKGGKGPSAD
jgi:hypothetical protein